MSRTVELPRCSAGCAWQSHDPDGICLHDGWRCVCDQTKPCAGHQTRNVNRFNPQRSAIERERLSK